MDIWHILVPIVTMVVGMLTPKLSGRQKQVLVFVVKILKELIDVLQGYMDGHVSRQDAKKTLHRAKDGYEWITDVFQGGNKSTSAHKAKLLFVLAPVALMLCTGCAAYKKHVAPYVPAVTIGANVDAAGVGGHIGFTSEWTGEKRSRKIKVSPDIHAED